MTGYYRLSPYIRYLIKINGGDLLLYLYYTQFLLIRMLRQLTLPPKLVQ